MSLTAAQELFVEIIRHQNSPQLKGVITKSFQNKNIDWSEFLVYSPFAAALIYKLFGTDAGLPFDIEPFKNIYELNLASNILKRKVIIELAKAFSDGGVDVIFLKGSALIFSVYQNDIGLRRMCDIDILIREADFETAESHLTKLGFQNTETSSQRIMERKWAYHLSYAREIVLELHWHFERKRFRNRQYDELLNHFFVSAETIDIENTLMKFLSPTDQILFSLYHIDHHLLVNASFYIPLIRYYKYGKNIDALIQITIYQYLNMLYDFKMILLFYKSKIDWLYVNDLIIKARSKIAMFSLLFWSQRYLRIPLGINCAQTGQATGFIISMLVNINFDIFVKLRCLVLFFISKKYLIHIVKHSLDRL